MNDLMNTNLINFWMNMCIYIYIYRCVCVWGTPGVDGYLL